MAHSLSPNSSRSFARLDTRCRCMCLFLLALSIGNFLAHAYPLEDTPSVCKDRNKFKIRVDGERIRYCDWVGEEDTEARCNTPYENKKKKKKKRNKNKMNNNGDTEEGDAEEKTKTRRKKKRNNNGDTEEGDTEEDDTEEKTKARRRRKKKRNNNSDTKWKTKILDARKLCTCTCAEHLQKELDPGENLCPEVMNDGIKNGNCLNDGYQQNQSCEYNWVWNGCIPDEQTCMPVDVYTCYNEQWTHRKNQIQFCDPLPRELAEEPGTVCQVTEDVTRPPRDPSDEDSTGDNLPEELDPLEKLCPNEMNDGIKNRNCLESEYQRYQACNYNWVWSGCTLEELRCMAVDSYTCYDEGEWIHRQSSIQFCEEIRGVPRDELPEPGTECQETGVDVARQRRRGDPPSAEDGAGDDLLQIRRR
mmetsp:Transcript_12012/g.28490  ORF Transcript_12012/g.28490 Transcript_12012/m.28490 type:complete len:417 (+) Transcript_12012:195-1445(+)